MQSLVFDSRGHWIHKVPHYIVDTFNRAKCKVAFE